MTVLAPHHLTSETPRFVASTSGGKANVPAAEINPKTMDPSKDAGGVIDK
jgi:hypothetical protein